MTLRLKVEYAICEKLCVPAEGSADLLLAAGMNSSNNEVLAAAEARVPRPASVGENAASGGSQRSRGAGARALRA